MPRALTIQRTIVPASERPRYLARARERAAYYAKAGCRFWVFEEAALPGAFIEFTEAGDRTVLSSAHAGAPEKLVDAKRIYQEVELS
jgi:hypothetical protein